jgi:hypothetical protein
MMNPYDGDLSCEQIQAAEITLEGGEALRRRSSTTDTSMHGHEGRESSRRCIADVARVYAVARFLHPLPLGVPSRTSSFKGLGWSIFRPPCSPIASADRSNRLVQMVMRQ